ncbi:MAG: hypothetical protein MHM6MM_008094 [Cercozoa sp. M6MM]
MRKPQVTVDRSAEAPALLRCFLSDEKHNDDAAFADGAFPEREVRVYAWRNSSLRHVTQLLLAASSEEANALCKSLNLEFALVSPDAEGKMTQRVIGQVNTLGPRTPTERQTLEKLGFVSGDLVDVRIGVPPPRRQPVSVTRMLEAAKKRANKTTTTPAAAPTAAPSRHELREREKKRREIDGDWRAGKRLRPVKRQRTTRRH